MKPILAVIFLTVVEICSGDTLRISELADAAGEYSERMVLKNDGGEEALFVKTQSVLGDADVNEAWPDPTNGGRIIVKLNEEGGKKLRETTARMQHGRDRLAIIVDGRLISAPVVQGTLDSSFVISGFEDLAFRALDDLARKMSGRPSLPEGEDPEPPKSLPKIETVPFTEEEDQANKASREKMGIFYIDSVPTEEQLDKVLRQGMEGEEVIKLFGKPSLASGQAHDDEFYFIYQIAPEKRPDNPKREVFPDGFRADFSGGKLTTWSLTYSDAPREEKVVGREESTLKMLLPEMDLSAGVPDLVALVEGIVVPDPKQSVNKRDLGDLISIAMTLPNNRGADAAKATLNADCDFMRTLSHNFADIAALRKNAENGRVRIDKLNEMLRPYAHGEKAMPVQTRRVEKDGGGQTATPGQSK